MHVTYQRPLCSSVRKAGKKLAQLEKKQALRPVIIEGGVIARTWWGKAWNNNLESYADYIDQLGGGRSAVRNLQVQVFYLAIATQMNGTRLGDFGARKGRFV